MKLNMKTKKGVSLEKRIYVVVVQSVTADSARFGIPTRHDIPTGMQAAQAAHVVSKMVLDRAGNKMRKAVLQPCRFTPTTTIVLSARNTKEMWKIWSELGEEDFYSTYFEDTNSNFYDNNGKFITAICTEPITANLAERALGHLELA